MINDLTTTLFDLAISGNLGQFYVQLFNFYFPFGMVFWMVGIGIFAAVQLKTKNFAFSGSMLTLYLVGLISSGWVVNAYILIAMKYFGLVVGLITGYYLYKSWKDS